MHWEIDQANPSKHVRAESLSAALVWYVLRISVSSAKYPGESLAMLFGIWQIVLSQILSYQFILFPSVLICSAGNAQHQYRSAVVVW